MPQCPICNAAVWVGQQYCSICGNPLPRPEGEDHLCPECGDRLTTKEEVCQKCQAPSPKITGIPLTTTEKTWRFPLGGRGFFLGAGLIAVALVLVFLFHNRSDTPQPVATPPSQADFKPTPPAPVVPAAAPKPSTPAVAEVQKPPVSPTPAVSTTAVETPATPATTKPLPRYIVTINELSVREGPATSSPRIGILRLKEEVELLETSGGWGKVRDEERHILGWSYMRYLQPLTPVPSVDASGRQPADSEKPETISAKVSQELPR